MASEDLRDWLAKVDSLGELRKIDGVDWNLEMTYFIVPSVSGDNTSCFLFDNIKDYPSGYRVAIPRLATAGQVALTMNLPAEASLDELIEMFQEKWPQWEARINEFPPKVVKSGPVLENVHSGDDVDLFEFPVPKWHILDGGRYIGTAHAVITGDPDTGETNLGTYRVQAHDKKTCGIYIGPGKHGRLHYEKYHAKGQACPIVVTIGDHPLLFLLGGAQVVGSEYNWAGSIRGEPIEVITEEVTGLPIPANSEIVLAGWVPPDKTRTEGPLGEWTGYYGRPPTPLPIIEVERVYHRNNPILTGAPPLKPTDSAGISTKIKESAGMHNELIKWGVPDVKRVWGLGPAYTFLAVSIKQKYAGHAKRVGLLTSQITNEFTRYVVVVDEDINPSNINDVLWALCFRTDPEKDIDIIRNTKNVSLDPYWVPGTPLVTSVAIIDACKPFERLDEFPKTFEVNPDLASKFKEKWKGIIS